MTDRTSVHEPPSTADIDHGIPRRELLVLVVAAAVASAAVVGYLVLPAARIDYYFDEMWRAAEIRSPNPFAAYRSGPAPLPPGWVIAMSGLFRIIPSRHAFIRAAAVAWAIPASIFLALTIRQLFARALGRAAVPMAVGAAILTVATTAYASHAVYLNNYLADLAIAAALVWVVVSIDVQQGRSATLWKCAIAVGLLAPWIGQGALLLVPGGIAILARHRGANPRAALTALITFVASSLVVGFAFLIPVSRRNGGLESFWASETPDIGWWNLVHRMADSFVDAAYPPWAQTGGMLIVALAGSVAGLVLLQRAWRWWLPWYLSAQLLALVGALIVGWPATFVRVNVSFQVLVLVAAPVAVCRGLVALAHGHATTLRGVTAVVLAAALAWAWLPRDLASRSTNSVVFARGLSTDLDIVADNVGPDDLVAGYHLSGPYVRDRLDNSSDVPRSVRVFDEAIEGPLTRERLGSLIDSDTGAVWCVIPYDAGPEATEAACDLGDAWTETFETRAKRAVIMRFERADE